MYARLGGRTVLSLAQMYAKGPPTWKYETAFGPLCNSTGRMPLGPDVRYFSVL
jgi:hypothetical protein